MNSFEELFELRGRDDLLREFASLSPPSSYDVSEHLQDPMPWRCGACGGMWSTSVQHRLRRKDQGRCPHCNRP